jgi:hypothetical protein
VVPRARGWWRLVLAVLLALAVPLVAQLRVIVPIEQTVLFIGPAMAACALAGWMLGGKFWLFAAWGGLAVWMLSVRVAAAGAFDPLSRGWVLLLAAAFGLMCVLGRDKAFFPRALAATALALGVAILLLLVGRSRVDDLGRSVASEFSRRLDVVTREYETRTRTAEWREFARRFPNAIAVIERGEQQLPEIARGALTVFPALLGLQSLALLALAWALFHRASRARIGPPLRTLAEFRFSDQLVWGVVLGVTLLVVPSLREARGIGLNLVVFFGALYALRGLGVLSWFLAPGRPTPVLLVIAAVVAGPVVGIFSLGLGLADTWIDWRGRMRSAT